MNITIAVTMYIATLNAPLFCGGTYNPAQEWVAWDFAVNGGQCGDIIRIEADGITHEYPALDSGRFGRHCVRQLDGTCPRIAVDVPEHLAWFAGLSTLGTVRNISAEQRAEEAPQREKHCIVMEN